MLAFMKKQLNKPKSRYINRVSFLTSYFGEAEKYFGFLLIEFSKPPFKKVNKNKY